MTALNCKATINVYFSDQTNTSEIIQKQVQSATNKLWIAMYSFTDYQICAAVIYAHTHGADVRIIADKGEAATSATNCITILQKALGTNNITEIYGRKGKYSLMHDKFAIIDDKIIITGSYNWTMAAKNVNWENLLVISDTNIVSAYTAEFKYMGGSK